MEALLAVQEVDTDLDRHRHRRATLEERDQASELAGRLRGLDADLAAAEEAVNDVAVRQSALEADLAATESRITGVNRRLYGGEVSAPRDLEAMAADVRAMERRRSELEDRGLEILEEREPLDERVAALVVGREEVVAAAGVVADRIAAAEAEIDAEMVILDERRRGLAAVVAPDLLATYERLRARLGGVGAARLVGSRCDGCHLILPAADLDRIRHLPADAVVTCEECGRILVRP